MLAQLRIRLTIAIAVGLAAAIAIACSESLPSPTPEGPGILKTVDSYMAATASAFKVPTPESAAILATIRAETPLTVKSLLPDPIPTATPEAPGIMATVELLLATPSPTPTPTRTPGPTATPYSSVTQTVSVDWATTKVVPLKLATGVRIEGTASVAGSQVSFSVSIQNPLGQIDYDSAWTQATNFLFVAPAAGNYSLLLRNGLNPVCGDPRQCTPPAVSITYSYQLFGN